INTRDMSLALAHLGFSGCLSGEGHCRLPQYYTFDITHLHRSATLPGIGPAMGPIALKPDAPRGATSITRDRFRLGIGPDLWVRRGNHEATPVPCSLGGSACAPGRRAEREELGAEIRPVRRSRHRGPHLDAVPDNPLSRLHGIRHAVRSGRRG